jgi:hypothetical protein
VVALLPPAGHDRRARACAVSTAILAITFLLQAVRRPDPRSVVVSNFLLTVF